MRTPILPSARFCRALALSLACALLLAAGLAGGPALAREKPHPAPLFVMPEAALEPARFANLPGWAQDDHRAALATFRASCGPILRGTDEVTPPRPVFLALRPICREALRLPRHTSEARARRFFEQAFRPVLISPIESPTGFLTGYYEPELEGSLTPTAEFTTPIYRRPADLILESPAPGVPANRGQAFRREGDRLVPYYDRAAIDDGALKDRGLEIVWVRSAADVFFTQIQGSARVRLPDGTVLRLNYDGHNGQTYTPVGRILVERGIVPREKISMDAIRAYIADHPAEGRELMRQNKSYVFFRLATELSATDGAVGAQGLPLTAGRSIAVDRRLHVYGTPFFIDARLPLDGPGTSNTFQRLMIAQDTGSAIVGPARADLFLGAGAEAGSVAGRIQNRGRFIMLLPRRLDPTRAPPPPRPPRRPAHLPAEASSGAGGTP
ncbi:murein transglycosylase A [Ancylobacter lacus]|uniref:murein transglycosylase A n=1 Tax=Ancylobacter lacus TaxID=2579970 RepID=UPI0031B7F167